MGGNDLLAVLVAGGVVVSTIACGGREQPVPGATSIASASAELQALLEDVGGATGSRYGVHDDQGHVLDGLAIIPAGDGDGFVGVSHWWNEAAAEFRLGLATSDDLLTWSWRAELARQASQPAIAPASDGGYVVAWEQEPDNHLAFASYPTWEDLLGARPSKAFQAPQRLSDCAEGTPNLLAASSRAVEFGFHYFAGCDLDREARGTMDWTSWSATPRPELDKAILSHGVEGGIGDRDTISFRGHEFLLVEAMSVRDDWSTWRIYLVDEQLTAVPLTFATQAGSRAFTNPTAAIVDLDGRATLVVTLFVPSEGAAGGESGELIFHRPVD